MRFDSNVNRRLTAHASANTRLREALRLREGEDEAVASLYAAEDAILALLHPSPRLRIVQADIRLRRRGVAAESSEEWQEITEIRRALGDAVEALDKMMPVLHDGVPNPLSGHCYGRMMDGAPEPDLEAVAAA